MKRITHTACPLCEGDALKPRFEAVDYFATGEKFMIYQCEGCGFVFTQNFPDEAEISPYYNSPTYISHSNTNNGIINRVYHVVRSFMLCRKTRLVRRLSHLRHGRLMDYGAGTGYFARAMANTGWNVTAVEKSEQARFFALENFKLRMQAPEAISSFESNSFDVITLWHVMEHIQSLDLFWDELHRLLDTRGIAVVAVPNSSSFDAKHYKRYWAAYDVPRHLWHFNQVTMMKLARKHGFILEHRYSMPFDGFYVSILSEKYKGSRLPLLKGLWFGTLGWLASFVNRSAASSIIYVFRKAK